MMEAAVADMMAQNCGAAGAHKLIQTKQVGHTQTIFKRHGVPVTLPPPTKHFTPRQRGQMLSDNTHIWGHQHSFTCTHISRLLSTHSRS